MIPSGSPTVYGVESRQMVLLQSWGCYLYSVLLTYFHVCILHLREMQEFDTSSKSGTSPKWQIWCFLSSSSIEICSEAFLDDVVFNLCHLEDFLSLKIYHYVFLGGSSFGLVWLA